VLMGLWLCLVSLEARVATAALETTSRTRGGRNAPNACIPPANTRNSALTKLFLILL
jgi:hypothetical protein